MDVIEFAKLVLFSPNLDDKLFVPERLSTSQITTEIALPNEPARSQGLELKPKESRKYQPFPNLNTMEQERARGIALHFFANHELLALELMALAILKFPKAEPEFKRGLAQIMLEEQRHLQAYLTRMHDFGVSFGDIAANDFFWIHGCKAKSPLQFISQLSLTFEQANLDFALYYHRLFSQLDDMETAVILEKVYHDEIGHLRHGLHWFQKWKTPGVDDFEVYAHSLPYPLDPSRAKGPLFDEEGRTRAGLSPEFIRQVKFFASAKSRRSNLYIFSPFSEEALGLKGVNYSPTESMSIFTRDLAVLAIYLANHEDVVLVPKLPVVTWRQQISPLLKSWPEMLVGDVFSSSWPAEIKNTFEKRKHILNKVHWWGGVPKISRDLGLMSTISKNNLPLATYPASHQGIEGLRQVSSKRFSFEVRRKIISSWNGCYPFLPTVEEQPVLVESLEQFNEVKTYAKTGPWCAKAFFSNSGRGIKRLLEKKDWEDPNLINWLKGQISTKGGVILEPWYQRIWDLSILLEVNNNVRNPLINVRPMLIDERGHYIGHVITRKKTLPPEIYQRPEKWEKVFNGEFFNDLAKLVDKELKSAGYEGPASLDLFFYQDGNEIKLQPLSEINPRYTMGRVAQNFEKRISMDAIGLFCIKDVSYLSYSQKLTLLEQCINQQNGLSISMQQSEQLRQGLFWLTPPSEESQWAAFLSIASDLDEAKKQLDLHLTPIYTAG